MVITSPADAIRTAHAIQPGTAALLKPALRAMGQCASRLFHRFVQARIATECRGAVRPLSRRGRWHSWE